MNEPFIDSIELAFAQKLHFKVFFISTGDIKKMFKPKATQATRDQTRVTNRNALSENLRKQRLANEDSRKAVGLWGELSVVTIEHDGSAFVHLSKGSKHDDYFTLSQKRPSEISKQEHALLSDWLRRRQYEGFSSTINAWNLSLEEAQRVKGKTISDLVSTGRLVLNPPE